MTSIPVVRSTISVALLLISTRAMADQTAGEMKSPRSVQPMMVVTVPRHSTSSGRGIGGYTRLSITYRAEAPDWPLRNYREEQRSFLSRYFAGKTIARLLTVNATVSRPLATTSATLVSVGLISNRKSGETWTSEIDPQRLLTPLIRIDPDGAVKLDVATAATSSYELSVAGGVLDIVKRGAALVAPQTTLLTSLNKDRFQSAAAFVDQSLSSLLQQAITERVVNDFPLADWAGDKLVEIDLTLPIGTDIAPPRDGGKPQNGFRQIGHWTISASAPVLSVFVNVPFVRTEEMTDIYTAAAAKTPKTGKGSEGNALPSACGERFKVELQTACRAFRALDPQAVLDFPVDSGVPLGQALAGDAHVAAAREKLVSDKAPGNTESANALCTAIADKTHNLGFNRVDTAVVLWAYASQSFITRDASRTIRKIENCAPLATAYALGLPESTFAGDPTPTSVKRSGELDQSKNNIKALPIAGGTQVGPAPSTPPTAATAPATVTPPVGTMPPT